MSRLAGRRGIFLERLLDGLDVAFEPLVVSDGSPGCPPGHRRDDPPSVRWTTGGGAVFHVVGGVSLRVSRHRVVIVPAHAAGRGLPDDGLAPMSARARAARVWRPPAPTASDPDVRTARGTIRVTYLGSMGLFDLLREPLVERLLTDDPLWRGFQELVDEIGGQRPGYRTMAEALLRRCLILILRRQHDRDAQRLSWLAPLEDARLGRAVSAMQDRPEHSFTLPALAEVAGMSRSVFAARFADVLGQSPIEFLKALRLARATRLLLATDLPVKSVATRVGYSSRSSFTRAFAACHGVGPMAFRAAAREPTTSPWSGPLGAGVGRREAPGRREP